MSNHPYNDDGHVCPTCGAGPFTCTMEDGDCENDGGCDRCAQSYCTGDWQCGCEPCNSPS